MLVISRVEGERVNLYAADGSLIGTVVLAVCWNRKVRIGFEDFDRSVKILRAELPPPPRTQAPAEATP